MYDGEKTLKIECELKGERTTRMYPCSLQNSLLGVFGGRGGEGREALCALALPLPT